MSANAEANYDSSNTQKVIMNMSDKIELYHKSNSITRKDAELCLQEYAPKFNWWRSKARILDIGSGDGSVTAILTKYLPADYQLLIGADKNPKSAKFANDKYGTKKIKFVPLNIEGEIPDDMKSSYDHVFSFYTLNWVDDLEKALKNIYNMLEKNGEFFTIFMTFSDFFLVFEILSKTNKWAKWMKDFYKFPSPYYEFEDPDIHVSKILNKIGFNILDVRCKQRVYHFESIEIMKGLVTAANPFNIPEDLWPEFLDDYLATQRAMQLHDETRGTIKSHYNLLLIHCNK